MAHIVRPFLAAIILMVIASYSMARGNGLSNVSGDSGKKPPRAMSYYPDGGDIVCVNGTNRYTRPLYGSISRFRLETSDRPVFATYNREQSVNITFFIANGSQWLPLDSTSFCEARYQGGRRDYTLGDESWGNGSLQISTLATYQNEGAIWQFHPQGFETAPQLRAIVRQVANSKMVRDGDYGLESRSSFEGKGQPIQILNWSCDSDTYILLTPDNLLENDTLGITHFHEEEQVRQSLLQHLHIDTPDPFINTVGANLVAAADGLWDGQTWLHGACGWRTPLAGWRAAYVADVLGWNDRAISHFDAYARSMVTDVPPIYPHPTQDSTCNLARAAERWGTQMYSNGYICKSPGSADKMSHYDMNLNYIDELLWHFCHDADTTYMRQMWPVIKAHLEWEKRNFDPDGDHLYDAYCCIWASDALYYNGGAVTHSSAYNYRGNLLAARIAEIIGEDPTPYASEANAILSAMNRRLWIADEGHWAEYQDLMGLRRLHKSAAIWSVYTPIDCGACSPEQAWQATVYASRHLPQIPVEWTGDGQMVADEGEGDSYATMSTSDWLPYDWSINNVAHAEVMNMALAFFLAGRNDKGFNLLKSDVLDGMFLAACPGNFGQISYYDKARSEAYRDFGDNIGVSARALVNGLFGIHPDALYGRCHIQHSFPDAWDHASISTPYLEYTFHREGSCLVYEITQHFTRPLTIILQVPIGNGRFVEIKGSAEEHQTLIADTNHFGIIDTATDDDTTLDDHGQNVDIDIAGLADFIIGEKQVPVDMSKLWNANVDDIFRNEYLSPRPPYTTLQIPKQGIGQWCQPQRTAHIEDDGLRAKSVKGVFDTGIGVSFLTPVIGHNIAYTSLWDNYPDSVVVPLKGKASYACLLMAGSTNSMQSRIDNGIVCVEYRDGSCDTLHLENPINWYPIEQEYYIDQLAFTSAPLRPYRVHLGTGVVARELTTGMAPSTITDNPVLQGQPKKPDNPDTAEPRLIDCGAAEILKMPLDPHKRLSRLTLRTLSNDVVIGLMAVTLLK